MTNTCDPFAHHPELRNRIADPGTSFFREFRVESLIQEMPDMAHLRDWAYSDAAREKMRQETLAEHEGDLWVFGYGSLMWDPSFYFSEVRRAHAQGYSRKLILMDTKGARGTEDAPGLMAALDRGGACDGLAFRIDADEIDTETEVLWRREIVGPAYTPHFITVEVEDRSVTALTFLADHSVEDICADLPRATQIRYIAQGQGILGTSREYLANIVSQFEALGICDEDCESLLSEVDAYLLAQGVGSPRAMKGAI